MIEEHAVPQSVALELLDLRTHVPEMAAHHPLYLVGGPENVVVPAANDRGSVPALDRCRSPVLVLPCVVSLLHRPEILVDYLALPREQSEKLHRMCRPPGAGAAARSAR